MLCRITIVQKVVLVLALIPVAGSTQSSVIATCSRDPLLGARSVAVDIIRGGDTMQMEIDQKLVLFHEQPEREAAFREDLAKMLEIKLEEAGYEYESAYDYWHTTDRAKYERTGTPHHTLYVGIRGRRVSFSDSNIRSYVFIAYVFLDAEFLTPDHENVTTYSRELLGTAIDSDLEEQIATLVSTLVDNLLDEGNCLPPQRKIFRSADGSYSVEVTEPGCLDLLGYLREDIADGRLLATGFAEPRSGTPEQNVTFRLDHWRMPDRVLVTNDGRFVVTINRLDCWAGCYSNQRVIDIYRFDGTMVRSLSLGDLFTERDISNRSWPLPSVRVDHFLDERAGVLVLSIPLCAKSEKNCTGRFSEIGIMLDTGEHVRPKRDLLPHWEARVALAGIQPSSPPAAPDHFKCRPGWDWKMYSDVPWVPFVQLLPEVPLPMPEYSEVGRRARFAGDAELEVLINKFGEVGCSAITKDLPLGTADNSGETALSWRLKPPSSGSEYVRSSLRLTFDVVLVPPPSN